MDLSVVICTWNRSKTLPGVLASLEKCVVPPAIQWEVVIVDNNSTDDTRNVCQAFVNKHPGTFRYIFEARQGKSFAQNTGIQNASGEIIALTDDDVAVDSNWIAELHKAFLEHDCAGIGGRIIPRWTCPKPDWLGLDTRWHHPAYGAIVRFEKGDSPFVLDVTAVGANLAFRRSVFAKHGFFRTDLSGNHADHRRLGDLLGGEDTEYCRRIMNAGEKIVYAPRAVVHHPAEANRVNKKYLQTFAFHYGRYICRIHGVPEEARCIFGIPRYMYPWVLTNCVKWVFAFDPRRRAYYRMETWFTFGEMAEGKRCVRQRGAISAGAKIQPAGDPPPAPSRTL